MLGRKSASWFLVYDRPRGMSMWREYMPLNTLYTKDPFPKDSPEGHPKFWLESPLDGGVLDFLVGDDRDGAGRGPVAKKTGRKSGEAVEVEVSLDDREIAYACAAGMCGKWEVPGMPAFERCSGCKTRRYCSTEVCHLLLFIYDPPLKRLCCILVPEGRLEGTAQTLLHAFKGGKFPGS
jgi:hypothetical protein